MFNIPTDELPWTDKESLFVCELTVRYPLVGQLVQASEWEIFDQFDQIKLNEAKEALVAKDKRLSFGMDIGDWQPPNAELAVR